MDKKSYIKDKIVPVKVFFYSAIDLCFQGRVIKKGTTPTVLDGVRVK